MKIPNNFTDKMIDKLKKIYPILSKEEILSSFPNYKWRNLQNIANALKLKKTYSEIRNGKIENLFDNTNESFYWLGLIASDGTILEDGTLKVELAIKDRLYLNNLALFLNTKLYIYPKYKSCKKGGTGTCRIKIKNLEEGKKLRDLLKITGKKTYNPISIDFIDTIDHFICFLIGFIDGDGSISKEGAVCIDFHKNWEPIVLKLIEILSREFENINPYLLRYKDMVRLNMNKKLSKILKTKLYELQLPYMERKWTRVII